MEYSVPHKGYLLGSGAAACITATVLIVSHAAGCGPVRAVEYAIAARPEVLLVVTIIAFLSFRRAINDILFHIPVRKYIFRRKFGIELYTMRLGVKDMRTGEYPIVKNRYLLWSNYILGVTMLIAFVWNMSSKSC